MLLISSGLFGIEHDEVYKSSNSNNPNALAQCINSFQTYIIANCPELPWHWILITAPDHNASYSTVDPNYVAVLKANEEGIQGSCFISTHKGIVLNYLGTLFTEKTTLAQLSFVVLLEAIGCPISFNFLSDCRDFLSEKAIPYLLACPADSLLTRFTDDSGTETYGLKGDAILVMKHMNVLSVTAKSLDIVIESCADEVYDNIESKLRLCLTLIAFAEKSSILYVDKGTLGICFGEKGLEEATVNLISCQFNTTEGYSFMTPVEVLIRFCALMEHGMSPRTALTTLVAQM